MGKKVAIVAGIVVLLALVGGGGFLWGNSVGQAQAAQNRFENARNRSNDQGNFPQWAGQTPQPGQQGSARPGAGAGGGLMGTIESIEGDTVVITTQDGSVRVKTTDTTLIQKMSSVTVKDLATGEQVMVSGSKNADGSYTARAIESLRAFQSLRSGQQ